RVLFRSARVVDHPRAVNPACERGGRPSFRYQPCVRAGWSTILAQPALRAGGAVDRPRAARAAGGTHGSWRSSPPSGLTTSWSAVIEGATMAPTDDELHATHEQNRRSWNAVTPAHNSHKHDQAGFLRGG